MIPEPVSNGLTLWRCSRCPVLIPGFGRIASVVAHEQQHEREE